jgi:cytochrome P450
MSDTLAAEASIAIQRNWGDDAGNNLQSQKGRLFTNKNMAEWHEVALNSTVLNIVAQISSRIFTGEKLCHDPQWLHIVISFTTNVMTAVYDLNLWPKFLRRIASHFLPSCRRLQTQIKRASNLIDLTVAERRAERAASNQRRERPQAPSDAIGWLEDIYNGRQYDPTVAQLLLAFAGIHTTSDLMTKALFDISSDPELIDNLRKEIISVIGEQGWSKNSLYNLKLMDSALKESQRLKPLRICK